MILQLEHIQKNYGTKTVLKDCTFSFERGKSTVFWEETGPEKPLCSTVLPMKSGRTAERHFLSMTPEVQSR